MILVQHLTIPAVGDRFYLLHEEECHDEIVDLKLRSKNQGDKFTIRYNTGDSEIIKVWVKGEEIPKCVLNLNDCKEIAEKVLESD